MKWHDAKKETPSDWQTVIVALKNGDVRETAYTEIVGYTHYRERDVVAWMPMPRHPAWKPLKQRVEK